MPLVKRDKLYDICDYPKLTGTADGGSDTLVIGAGAAPWTFLGRNAEVPSSAKYIRSTMIFAQALQIFR